MDQFPHSSRGASWSCFSVTGAYCSFEPFPCASLTSTLPVALLPSSCSVCFCATIVTRSFVQGSNAPKMLEFQGRSVSASSVGRYQNVSRVRGGSGAVSGGASSAARAGAAGAAAGPAAGAGAGVGAGGGAGTAIAGAGVGVAASVPGPAAGGGVVAGGGATAAA